MSDTKDHLQSGKSRKKKNKLIVRQIDNEEGESSTTSGSVTSKIFKEYAPATATLKTITTNELLREIPTDVVNLKLDDVLETVKTLDRICDQKGCKAKTTLIGQDCNYCKQRYCFKHSLPEIHGCGNACKRDERKKFLHPTFTVYNGNSEKPQTRKAVENIQKLHVNFGNKLKDMQQARKAKPVGGKKREK